VGGQAVGHDRHAFPEHRLTAERKPTKRHKFTRSLVAVRAGRNYGGTSIIDARSFLMFQAGSKPDTLSGGSGLRSGTRCGVALGAEAAGRAEGVRHSRAGDGESPGDLSCDQVRVGGQAIFAFVVGHAPVGAQQRLQCGRELGDCGGPRL
jgi:hypothetical protein